MFCPNCGAKLEDGSLFCSECGTAVDTTISEDENSDKTELVDSEIDFGESAGIGRLEMASDPFAAASSTNEGFVDAALDTTFVAPDNRGVATLAATSAAPSQAAAAKSGGGKALIVVVVVAAVAILAAAALAIFMLRPQAPAEAIVQFETDGGTAITAQQVEEGTQITSPSNPTKSGYEFAGWYSNPERTDKVTFPLAVNEDMVLYAKWEEKEAETSSPSSTSSAVSATVGSSTASSANSASPQESYILPNSSDKRLSRDDLDSLSDDDLEIAMNEIWARHGRLFKNNWLQNYFNSQSWYKGTIASDDFLNKYTPTAVEDANSKLISEILTERGYDVNKRHPN